MILDREVLEELRKSWNGVRIFRERIQAATLGSFAQGGSFVIFIADAAHNLPFFHACSVLNNVLLQLEDEGYFKCNSIFLGALLERSENALPWKDFNLIKEGVDKRNNVAHKGEVIPRRECWKYIDAIESELVSWKIVEDS